MTEYFNKTPRKLNKAFFADLGFTAGGSAAAFVYDDVVGERLVAKYASELKPNLAVGLLMGVYGFFPIIAAATMPGRGPFWASFGGAIVHSRIANFYEAFESRRQRARAELDSMGLSYEK